MRKLGRAGRSRRRRDAIAIVENRDSVERKTIIENRDDVMRRNTVCSRRDQYYKGNMHRQRSPIRGRRNEYY